MYMGASEVEVEEFCPPPFCLVGTRVCMGLCTVKHQIYDCHMRLLLNKTFFSRTFGKLQV